MRFISSKPYLTLRRPPFETPCAAAPQDKGPSRRVLIRESRVFPQPALMFAFKGSDATICSAVAEEVGSEVRTAGDGTRRRRLNKLSCAGWVPHNRGSVSGLPHSRNERRSGTGS